MLPLFIYDLFCGVDERLAIDATIMLELGDAAMGYEFVWNGQDGDIGALLGMMLGKIIFNSLAKAAGFNAVLDGDDFTEML